MPVSSSPLAHRDIQAIMDRALSNGRGCRIQIANPGEGYSLRQRFYTMRLGDRAANCKVFDPEDPRYGRSVYDALTVYIASGNDEDPPESLYLMLEVSTEERLAARVEDL